MTLRNKLRLALSPLVISLVITGVAGSFAATSLGWSSEEILKDNYRSVLASERMKDAAERLNGSAVFAAVRGQAMDAGQVTALRRQFEEELQVQEHNITEPGEGVATTKLHEAWTAYFGKLARLNDLQGDAARDFYFDELFSAFRGVANAANKVLEINQDAMVQKAGHTEQAAKSFKAILILVSLGGCVIGLYASSAITARILRPLSVLTQAARRIGEGDLKARAVISGSDEIAQLAKEFNAMADHVAAYRQSSLGELLEAQNAAQATIDSLPDPVLVMSLSGHVQQVNRAAETLLGVQADMADQAFAKVQDPVREVISRVREHVLGGRGAYVPKGLEEAVRLSTREGERHFLPRGTPVYSEQGGVVGAAIVLQDVTRLLRFDELKNDLVATVAHEFRTPLTSVRMAIHLCTEEALGPLTPKQAEVLFAAREDCERLQNTVDELLDLSRIQSGRIELRKELVGIEEVVTAAVEVHRPLAKERGIDLQTDVYSSVATIFADSERIQLVLVNLLSNALHYTPSGGSIVVRASPAGTTTRFEVKDSGPGIPREYQQAIFEKYFRMPGAPRGGAGLGLYIAREMVQAHGGEIGVESEVGRGATFWFTVPNNPPSPQPTP
jgi:two-component system, NtrC family, sensor histidine kinase KinB